MQPTRALCVPVSNRVVGVKSNRFHPNNEASDDIEYWRITTSVLSFAHCAADMRRIPSINGGSVNFKALLPPLDIILMGTNKGSFDEIEPLCSSLLECNVSLVFPSLFNLRLSESLPQPAGG